MNKFLNVLGKSKAIRVNQGVLVNEWECSLFPVNEDDVAFYASWTEGEEVRFVELSRKNIENGTWAEDIFQVADDSGEAFNIEFVAGARMVLVT